MNKRQIAAALREAVFTPGKSGPMKVISEVGDPNYYIRRAMEELIYSLRPNLLEVKQQYSLSPDLLGVKQQYLTKALSLLALAKVTIDEKSNK